MKPGLPRAVVAAVAMLAASAGTAAFVSSMFVPADWLTLHRFLLGLVIGIVVGQLVWAGVLAAWWWGHGEL